MERRSIEREAQGMEGVVRDITNLPHSDLSSHPSCLLRLQLHLHRLRQELLQESAAATIIMGLPAFRVTVLVDPVSRLPCSLVDTITMVTLGLDVDQVEVGRMVSLEEVVLLLVLSNRISVAVVVIAEERVGTLMGPVGTTVRNVRLRRITSSTTSNSPTRINPRASTRDRKSVV